MTMQWLSGILSTPERAASEFGSAITHQASPISEASTDCSFPAGAVVEYFSKSKDAWILARVIKPPETSRLQGLYDLDCKAGVPRNKVRSVTLEPTLAEPTAAAPAVPSRGAPLQLVRVHRQEGTSSWRFEVDEGALQLLESYGQRRIAVCTVCGPYRSGKSFLLNRLVGLNAGEEQFGVGSTVKAHTEGLWLWGEANAETASSDEPAILYMDCEGFGSTDSDKTRDAKLMALCLLLSSVFVLNTKGVLSESLFNTLSLVSHFADHIEEDGHNMSHPGLLWLLRDFVLDLKDEQGFEISSDEYLERTLHSRPLAGADAERSQAACEVRQSLLKFFPQRHCETLVQPVIDEDKLQSLQTCTDGDLRPEFLGQLASVRAKVLELAHTCPKAVAGYPLTGTTLAALLRQFVDTLNSSQALNVKTAWEGVQHSVCAALIDELHGVAHAKLHEICNGATLTSGRALPVSNDELQRAYKQQKHQVKAQWQARFLGDDAVSREYYQDLA